MKTKFHAKLDVQLVGYTVYKPPTDPETGSPVMPHDISDTSFGRNQSLMALAGRGCYESFDNPKGRTIPEYLWNILKQKHGSVLEHASVSFRLTGISRACSHEIVRHRHHSFSQLSQRYVDARQMGIVVPPAMIEFFAELVDGTEKTDEEIAGFLDVESVKGLTRQELIDLCAETYAAENYGEVNARYTDTMEELAEMFPHMGRKALRGAARSELTEAVETRMVITANLRAWMDFLVQRDAPSADAEIRAVAQEIGRHLADYAPAIFGPEGRALWDDASRHEVDHTPAAPPEV
jgi:thymidylate synthase (FAD)